MIAISALLVGCQSLDTDGQPATLSAEMTAYVTQAAALRQNAAAGQAEVLATVQVAETQAAGFFDYNRRLLQTVQAVQIATPLPRVVQDDGGVMPREMFDLSSGELRVLQIGTAGFVDDNRCFQTHQNFFTTSSTNVIYLAGLALNLPAGATVTATWQYGNDVVHRSSYTAPNFVDYQCFALPLRPSDAPFLPGNWTASLSVDGEVMDNAYGFSILDG